MSDTKRWNQCEVLNIRTKGKSIMWIAVNKYNLTEGKLISLKDSDDIYKVEKIFETELPPEVFKKRVTFASLKD